jgi:hypothetical protein
MNKECESYQKQLEKLEREHDFLKNKLKQDERMYKSIPFNPMAHQLIRNRETAIYSNEIQIKRIKQRIEFCQKQ